MWLKLIRTNVTGPIQTELLVRKYVTTSEESFDAVCEEARTSRKKQMPLPLHLATSLGASYWHSLTKLRDGLPTT